MQWKLESTKCLFSIHRIWKITRILVLCFYHRIYLLIEEQFDKAIGRQITPRTGVKKKKSNIIYHQILIQCMCRLQKLKYKYLTIFFLKCITN